MDPVGHREATISPALRCGAAVGSVRRRLMVGRSAPGGSRCLPRSVGIRRKAPRLPTAISNPAPLWPRVRQRTTGPTTDSTLAGQSAGSQGTNVYERASSIPASFFLTANVGRVKPDGLYALDSAATRSVMDGRPVVSAGDCGYAVSGRERRDPSPDENRRWMVPRWQRPRSFIRAKD